MNEKERRLLEFIAFSINENGYPPAIREMLDVIKVTSTRGVTYHLDELQRNGYIHRNRKSRSITLLERGLRALGIFMDNMDRDVLLPIYGKVAAGNPIFIEENFYETMSVPRSIAKNDNEYFGLIVEGESMIGSHILPNDLIIIKKQNFAKNGDIVIAILDNSATLKTYYKENGLIKLIPSNPNFKPIIVNDNLVINGIMVGLIRTN